MWTLFIELHISLEQVTEWLASVCSVLCSHIPRERGEAASANITGPYFQETPPPKASSCSSNCDILGWTCSESHCEKNNNSSLFWIMFLKTPSHLAMVPKMTPTVCWGPLLICLLITIVESYSSWNLTPVQSAFLINCVYVHTNQKYQPALSFIPKAGITMNCSIIPLSKLVSLP